MKTLIALISALMFLSATVKADDIDKNRRKINRDYLSVPIPKFVMGDQDADAPLELEYLKIRKEMVPVAPFILIDFAEVIPEELGMVKAKNAFVPVAPFLWGNSHEELIELSETIKLNIVPVSSFTWGNPEETMLTSLN